MNHWRLKMIFFSVIYIFLLASIWYFDTLCLPICVCKFNLLTKKSSYFIPFKLKRDHIYEHIHLCWCAFFGFLCTMRKITNHIVMNGTLLLFFIPTIFTIGALFTKCVWVCAICHSIFTKIASKLFHSYGLFIRQRNRNIHTTHANTLL